MARLKLSQRNPDYLKPDGTLLYDRRERAKIWQAKLLAEFFSDRTPTHTQRFQIGAAALLLTDLSGAITSAHSPNALPKNFWKKFNILQRLLAGFKPKTLRGKKATAKESAPSLAALLGGEA